MLKQEDHEFGSDLGYLKDLVSGLESQFWGLRLELLPTKSGTGAVCLSHPSRHSRAEAYQVPATPSSKAFPDGHHPLLPSFFPSRKRHSQRPYFLYPASSK